MNDFNNELTVRDFLDHLEFLKNSGYPDIDDMHLVVCSFQDNLNRCEDGVTGVATLDKFQIGLYI